MLRFASNFMDNGDADTQRAVNKLDSISVHSYHFSHPDLYDPGILEKVRAEYTATGWKHMVTARPNRDPFSSDQTDLWISFAHADVTGTIVLMAAAKDVELIAITGDLSPLDLLHLRGHFGIPRFDGNVLVPAPAGPPSAHRQQPEDGAPAPAR
jgi:hypothetical protein